MTDATTDKLAEYYRDNDLWKHAAGDAPHERPPVPAPPAGEPGTAGETRATAMPERIRRRRTKGWRLPPNTVSVTRPGRWGNPFPASDAPPVMLLLGHVGDTPLYTVRPTTRAESVETYRLWLSDTDEGRELATAARFLLRGKNLACYCPLDGGPCHADELLRIANG